MVIASKELLLRAWVSGITLWLLSAVLLFLPSIPGGIDSGCFALYLQRIYVGCSSSTAWSRLTAVKSWQYIAEV